MRSIGFRYVCRPVMITYLPRLARDQTCKSYLTIKNFANQSGWGREDDRKLTVASPDMWDTYITMSPYSGVIESVTKGVAKHAIRPVQ